MSVLSLYIESTDSMIHQLYLGCRGRRLLYDENIQAKKFKFLACLGQNIMMKASVNPILNG